MNELKNIPTDELVAELVGREKERNSSYTVEDIISLGCPHLVRISFELPYHDWCIFEKSALFQNLTGYLEELQRQRAPNVLQAQQD